MPYSSEEIPSHRLVITPMNLWRHSRELRKVRTATKAAQIDHQENQSAWRLRIHDLVLPAHGVGTCASGGCYVAKDGFCLVHLVYLVGLVQPNRRDTPDRPNRPNEQDLLAEAQAPAPRLRLRSYGTARVVKL